MLSQAAIASNDPTRWFEELYAQAKGQTDQIPWARLTVHPHVQHWLDHRQMQGAGQRAMVIGCGLGDDAEALQALGFQVTAFDISETAIAWCRQRFPQSSVAYQVADLFALDPIWQQGFDLVVECRNVQALPLSVRSQALAAVAQLVAPSGTLLMVTRLRPDNMEPDGPPWPLSNSELAQLETQGLTEQQRHDFVVGDDPALPTVDQTWVEYRR